MKTLVVATGNQGKLSEIKSIFKYMPLKIISMKEAGVHKDIEENGTTFEENALIKAKAVFDATGHAVLADDSGLEVDFLNGAPGIQTARYAGEGASDMDRINKLLGELKNVPFEKRTARFVCAVAIILEDGSYFTTRGECNGYISFEPAGNKGFGYDPVFYVPEYDKTMAQLDEEVKNKISHRAKALDAAAARLAPLIKQSRY